jgi:hypothetical protein
MDEELFQILVIEGTDGYDLQLCPADDGAMDLHIYRPGATTSRYGIQLTGRQQYRLMLALAANLRKHEFGE